MPTIAIDGGVEFFYTDSGAPPGVEDYHTLIMIHGHSFHSGTFQRLLPLAGARRMRIICINRREYPGTTPFSADENRVIREGNEKERCVFLQGQGVGLAKFVCAVVDGCGLPLPAADSRKLRGGVTVGGWSMGNIYMLALVACVDILEEGVREKVKAYVTGFFMWDPPSQAIGAPEPPKSYLPLWDLSYPPEDRRPKFAIWVSSYFKHPPNPTHDPNALLYLQSESDASRKPSIVGLTPEQLASMLEVTAGDHSETKMLERDWLGATHRQMMKAVFSREVRRAWASGGGDAPVGFYLLYGDESVWNVVYAAWYIEDTKRKSAGDGGASEEAWEKLDVKIAVQKGANHFPMLEDPEAAWDAILECLSS